MAFWILKTEIECYSFEDLEREGIGTWDGVRNFQARNNLKAMKVGDLAFFYLTGKEKEIVGLVEVCEEAFPDPSAQEGESWVAVAIKPITKFSKTLKLSQIKQDDLLAHISLVKNSRLSVLPLEKSDFDYMLQLLQ